MLADLKDSMTDVMLILSEISLSVLGILFLTDNEKEKMTGLS